MRDNEAAGCWFGGVLIIALIFAGISWVFNHKQWATEAKVKELARLRSDDLPNETELSQTDAWGNRLQFRRSASDISITQTVVSAGKDGKFGTTDDIEHSDTDWNNSRMIGRFVGEKAREVIKGVKDSDKPSRFEKFTPPQEKAVEPETPRKGIKQRAMEAKERARELWDGKEAVRETPATTQSSNER